MEIGRDIYLKKLIASKHNGMIKIVTGVRRCGKSYLLFNLFHDHLKACGVDDSHLVEVDLEDRRNKSLRDPDALLHYIDSRMADERMYYILIDEIQHVKEFEDVLNSYLKVGNADIYVTGSNSRFLSKDVLTEFRGRGDEIRVHPLCFREFMSVQQDNGLEKGMREYMTYGGLPQILTLSGRGKKEEYLKALFESAYLKDIKERHRIKNDANLDELIDVMASAIGSLTNPVKLQNTFKSVKNTGVSFEMIKNYLDILQDAFLLEKSVRYDIKGRKYIDTPAKYYFEDLGLRNARLNFRQADEGHLMENLLYNELRVRGFSVDVGEVVYNYKDAQGKSNRQRLEVDFVCNQGFKRYYIQSAFDMPTQAKVEQELNSLSRIKDNFQKMIIVGGLAPTYQNDEGVILMNVFDFLLNEDSLDKFF
ncbi:MAG: ATP-binding protein [Mediterranea sp.]|jgi:predicted AAA+ superfamily ATPase|nr:ATP-binding protein [Mediterranea sp.]